MSGPANDKAASALLAQLEGQRLRWVPLQEGADDGPAAQLDTPSQFAAIHIVQALREGQGDRATQLLAGLVRNWRGITQASLLGAGVGSDDPAPYSPELLRAYLADRPDAVGLLGLAAVELANAARQRIAAASGN